MMLEEQEMLSSCSLEAGDRSFKVGGRIQVKSILRGRFLFSRDSSEFCE